jgi:hypothetical protein
MYLEDQGKDIKDGADIHVNLGEIFMSATREGQIVNMILDEINKNSVTVPIDLSNIQLCMAVYDVSSNRCIFFRGTDDEDYGGLEELVEELFEKF